MTPKVREGRKEGSGRGAGCFLEKHLQLSVYVFALGAVLMWNKRVSLTTTLCILLLWRLFDIVVSFVAKGTASETFGGIFRCFEVLFFF